MKRAMALLLILTMLFGLVVSLSGCGSENKLTKGEWLSLLNSAFGMYSYTSKEPYTDTVEEGDAFFDAVQIAFEWDVISDRQIDVGEDTTKGFAAQTLVNCVGMVDTKAMTEDEIITYAVEHGYVTFDFRGRTDSIRRVTRAEAESSLVAALEVWTTREFESEEQLTAKNGVLNLLELGCPGSDVYVDMAKRSVTIPEKYADGLVSGGVFIVPANNVDMTAAVYVAETIVRRGGLAVIGISDQIPEIEDVIEDMRVSGRIPLDLNNAVIRDGLGNIVSESQHRAINGGDGKTHAIGLGYSSTAKAEARPCAAKTYSFKTEGITVTGTVDTDTGSISFSVSGTMDAYKNKITGESAKINVGRSIRIDFSDPVYHSDYTVLDGVNELYARLDYATTDTTSLSYNYSLVNEYKQEFGKKPVLSEILTDEAKGAAVAKGAKTIKLCSVSVFSVGLASVDIDVKLKISVTGALELVVTKSNSVGIEYRNQKIRFIGDNGDKSTTLTCKAKVEATLYVGASIKLLGLNLVGFGAEFGMGIEATTTAHLVNSDNEKLDELSVIGNSSVISAAFAAVAGMQYEENGDAFTAHIDVCLDVTTYFILKVALDSDCIVAKAILLFNKNANLEYVFMDKSNATMASLCFHMEDGVIMSACSRKYGNDEDDEPDSDDEERVVSGIFDISTYFMNLIVGDSESLAVTDLPKTFELSDIVFTSSDPSVASVSKDGKITARSAGVVSIIVSIPNTEYETSCSVLVSQNVSLSGGDGSFGGGGSGGGR